MKRRIGILKGKPIIEGDINLKTSNEIHVKQLSGGSGESGGEASNIEYLDVSGSEVGKALCCMHSYQNKILVENDAISITSAIRSYNNTYIACSICFSDTVIVANDKTTILEDLEASGITKEQLDAIPRITKEEFYSL